jgi:hypothetical protein
MGNSFCNGEDLQPSDPRFALLSLVRLLARQAAREDYDRALAGACSKTYSKEQGRQDPIEES